MKTYQRVNAQIVWFHELDVLTLSADKFDDFNRAWFVDAEGGTEK